MFKNKDLAFTTAKELADFLAKEFRKTRKVKKHFPSASAEDLKYKHFDFITGIQSNPDTFRTAPHIVDGNLVGEQYIINQKQVKAKLETFWRYQRNASFLYAD